jgi:hypothetical protein
VSTIVRLESEWGGGATPHVLTSVSGPTYNCDPYRGPVLTSAPPIAYPNATQPAFPYGGFSFGPNFSMTSTSFSGGPTSYGDSLGTSCFSAVPSQLVTAGAVSSPGVRPYVMGLTDVSDMEGTRRWPRPILDLNAGPGTVDLEVRDSKQFAIADSRVSPEDQMLLTLDMFMYHRSMGLQHLQQPQRRFRF